MSIAVYLKNNLKNIPPFLGKKINYLPYGYRPGIGKIYRERMKEIKIFETLSKRDKEDFIFNRLKKIVEYSYFNIKFYKEYYDSNGFHPSAMKKMEDFFNVPITSKEIFNEYDIEERSKDVKGRYKVNTGGTSGTPFGLYILPSSMGHEWAHIHTIWERLEYKVSDFKLVFGGRSDLSNIVEYDVVRNHFGLDIYSEYDDIAIKLKNILRKSKIKYLHGYPSSIYDFALYCKKNDEELLNILKRQLKGAFLGSEYPHKHYRDFIEETFEIRTISWYGHTERAVLAYEKEKSFTYHPFHTYGFAEAIKNDNEYDLLSTSYYNLATPLIRYNTNDKVNNVTFKDGFLDSFEITKGREGEFILDKKNKKISLTGFIFGRHHQLFNESKFIQVKQVSSGEVEIHYVSDTVSEEKASSMFDSNNLELNIVFKKKEKPTRTISGKINLLIK